MSGSRRARRGGDSGLSCSGVEESSSKGRQRNIPDALREAIERTFAATADSAAETGERAQAALDEVSRRGQKVREAVTDRAQEAGQASASAASKVVEAIEGMRLASRDDVRELERRIEELSARIKRLESKPRVEG